MLGFRLLINNFLSVQDRNTAVFVSDVVEC